METNIFILADSFSWTLDATSSTLSTPSLFLDGPMNIGMTFELMMFVWVERRNERFLTGITTLSCVFLRNFLDWRGGNGSWTFLAFSISLFNKGSNLFSVEVNSLWQNLKTERLCRREQTTLPVPITLLDNWCYLLHNRFSQLCPMASDEGPLRSKLFLGILSFRLCQWNSLW